MDSSEEMSSDPDLFDKKYGDLDEEDIDGTEIKQVADYPEASSGVFFAGNGLSINYNEQFKQENFNPPALPWRKSTTHAFVDFLLGEGNIVGEDMWKNFSDMMYKLFREAFIYPILCAHKNLYDLKAITLYAAKLQQYKQIYTLNYDLLLPWTKLTNIRYIHGNINLMFSGDPPEEERTLQDYGIDIYQNFTNPILDNILEVRQKDDIVLTEVYGGNHDEKRSHIFKCKYLKEQFDSLDSISGNLIIFGCSVSANDKHLWEKIDSNDKIDRLWISIHEESKINELKSKVDEYFTQLARAGKVEYFDSKSFF